MLTSQCGANTMVAIVSKMKAVEDELIHDHFIIGIRDVKLRADLPHKKEDGAVAMLKEVITKTKVWETSTCPHLSH